MTALHQALADYLAVRRALGFKLERAEKLIGQFLDYLEERDANTITTEHALGWATEPAGADPWWWALRLNALRPFATYLHMRDARNEILPKGLIGYQQPRATPYLYSPAEIDALVEAAARRPHPLSAATYPALFGLLSVTGMRIGEALALEDRDIDPEQAIIKVRDGKFGKSRLLPLHPTSITALRDYQRARSRLLPRKTNKTLFATSTGASLDYSWVRRVFRKVTDEAGITARSASCRPRIHDLRHSFAVSTLLDAYRRGDDVQALLPRLSTYMGHANPKNTYWYLSAAPELLALAGDRLEHHLTIGDAA
ncbi:tyrosine-type recombinase/integrase (plasmid) [Streptosporangium sp. CA-135522]|uniref:tyrosine-type recombinase/integrase n=1 Tax=Streptosporangium sp. CA-135522 TaxID=3240072 RepID=UPI003D932F0F